MGFESWLWKQPLSEGPRRNFEQRGGVVRWLSGKRHLLPRLRTRVQSLDTHGGRREPLLHVVLQPLHAMLWHDATPTPNKEMRFLSKANVGEVA